MLGEDRHTLLEMKTVYVIGAGLAGSEAAFTAARQGVPVRLYEMRPNQTTPAHQTPNFAELVCSNSLGGEGETNAKGLLQAEMRAAGSLIMQAADRHRVPAGGALAVERGGFSLEVTQAIEAHPSIEVVRQELTDLPSDGIAVLATGPLTSDALSVSLASLLGAELLGFHDAAAPVVLGESINLETAYRAGRYGQRADYLNCPLNEEEYRSFFEVLTQARQHTPHDWEKLEFFAGCMPIEEIARRGYHTPRYGPMKPIGLPDPKTGKEPYAVVQLRMEDRRGQMWSLVGFQTGLKWGDQKILVQSIPGLDNAEIVRYGVMHRNTYLCVPKLIEPTMQFRAHPNLLVCGVLGGVEGYLESAATGFLAGLNAARLALGEEPLVPPEDSMLGGLVRYLSSANPQNFQPMNANWGLVPSETGKGKKAEKRARIFQRGLQQFSHWSAQWLAARSSSIEPTAYSGTDIPIGSG